MPESVCQLFLLIYSSMLRLPYGTLVLEVHTYNYARDMTRTKMLTEYTQTNRAVTLSICPAAQLVLCETSLAIYHIIIIVNDVWPK